MINSLLGDEHAQSRSGLRLSSRPVALAPPTLDDGSQLHMNKTASIEPNASDDGARDRRLSILLAILIALFSVVPFLPALDGGWVYDDAVLIADNRLVHSLSHARAWLTGELFDAPLASVQLREIRAFYRPLVVASYALDYFLGAGRPLLFHITNMLLHAAIAILAFRALRRWLGVINTWPAFWGALLFAVHPSKAESIAWISGRPDPMFALFLLLSLEGYQYARHARGRAALRWLVPLIFCTLALLSKETAVLLPLFFAFEEYSSLDYPALNRALGYRLLKVCALPLLLVFSYMMLRAAFLPLLEGSQSQWPIGSRIYLALETWGHLAELIVVPHDLSMLGASIRFSEGRFQPSFGYVALGAVVALLYLGLLAMCAARFKQRLSRQLFALALLTLGTFFPVLQIIPIGINVMTQARFLYLPLLPLIALGMVGFMHHVRALHAVCLVLFTLCFGCTWSRSGDFLTSERFWSYELAHNPTVPDAVHSQRGRDLRLGGSQLAMRRAICGFEFSQKYYASQGATQFLALGLDQAYLTLPDGSAELVEPAEFLAAIRLGRDAQITRQFKIDVRASSSAARMMRAESATWLIREASLRARLGQLSAAVELLEESLRRCPKCDDISHQAAKIAALMGNHELAQRYSAPLGSSLQATFRSVSMLIDTARASQGLKSAFELSGVGRLLSDPSLSLRAVLPYAELIENEAPEELRMTLALIAGQGGDLERALRLYASLSGENKKKMDELGFPEPIEDRASAFVHDTCALPSELR